MTRPSVDFSADIGPLLAARCQACHGTAQQLNGLRLDTRRGMLEGGYSGPAVIPGNSDSSLLVRMVSGQVSGVMMPPVGDRLRDDEVRLLRTWIDEGATWPREDQVAPSASEPARHWAFDPVVRPALPSVRRTDWTANAVDRFVLARLERERIPPAPRASPQVLARRLSLDLTGLPPSPEQVDALTSAADGAAAYERLVDELIESPHFGERWAIHWLDLARYADTDGYEKDSERPHAWRWREWVIDALNRDMPFDRFTIDQIAGDTLPEATVEQRVATGFHRNGLKNREGGVKLEQFRFEETVDRTNTIGTVWLGLTVACAQCHDHKYDPISQRDYYELFAYMNAVDEAEIPAPMPGEMGPYLDALPDYLDRRRELLERGRVYELQPAWESRMVEAADNPGKWTDWDHALDAVQKYLDNGEGIVRTPRALRTDREQQKLEDHFVKNYHRVISKEFWKELDWVSLREDLLRLRAETPDITYARAVVDSPTARQTHIHLRGGWNSLGVKVGAGTPRALPDPPPAGSHPRLALAGWLVSRDNPLTARVAVNRVWQEYFGRGIVPTADDFGTRSPGPSHPALLDWLASEFADGGWSLKKLHKLIVMSATYQQSSADRPELRERDPENVLLARQARLRLPAELLRDSALSVAGLLDPAIGGPSVRPPQPEGVADLAYAGSVEWPESKGRDRYRRGLYTFLQRTVPYPQLANFDMPDRTAAICTRERSNTPLQALNLLNDRTFVEAARALALRAVGPDGLAAERALERLFRIALSRPPSGAEVRHLASYFERQVAIFGRDLAAARSFMPLALPGMGPAESAALAGAASVVLNLDEFITRE